MENMSKTAKPVIISPSILSISYRQTILVKEFSINLNFGILVEEQKSCKNFLFNIAFLFFALLPSNIQTVEEFDWYKSILTDGVRLRGRMSGLAEITAVPVARLQHCLATAVSMTAYTCLETHGHVSRYLDLTIKVAMSFFSYCQEMSVKILY